MRLAGLANGKSRRCYYTCDHMIFMKAKAIHLAAGPIRTTIYPAAGQIRACSPDRRVNKDLFTRQSGQKYVIHPAEVIKIRHTAIGKMHTPFILIP